MKRLVILLVTSVLAMLPLQAQRTANNVEGRFLRIQMLLDKQHYTDAYAAADSLRKEAFVRAKKGDTAVSRVLLTSTWYMERAALNYQEDVKDSSLARFRAVMPYLTMVDSCVCYLFLEQMDSALAFAPRLQGVPNRQIAAFCDEPRGKDYVNMTPTMYDLLMHMALERVSLEKGIELAWQLVEYYRRQPDNKENENLLLYNELNYLRLRTSRPNTSKVEKKHLYQAALNRYRHTGNEQVAELYDELARLYNADNDYLTALAYCDSAIGRYPKSVGGVECANLRSEILAPSITLYSRKDNPADRDVLCYVKTRNVSKLYYRLVVTPETKQYEYRTEKVRAQLLGCKVLKSWSQPIDVPADHGFYKHYVYVPSLPAGNYTLLASPSEDFSGRGFYAESFVVHAAAFVQTSYPQEHVAGYLVDYTTGKPIANQKVELLENHSYGSKYNTFATVQTDRKGYYYFDKKIKNGWNYEYRLRTKYKGAEVMAVCSRFSDRNDSVVSHREFFLDRPVYRPGDTVQFLFVNGEVRHNREGNVSVGDSLKIVLADVNYTATDSLYGVTDAYGSLSGRLVVPANGLPGEWNLTVYRPEKLTVSGVRNGQKSMVEKTDWTKAIINYGVKVEAYKQPKFTVTLNRKDRKDAEGHSVQPQMGDSLTVEGLAASYTQVPVSGAKVKYVVKRSFLRPWWRRYWSGSYLNKDIICSDSTMTDAEGHFRISFVATPDSNIELSQKPCFIYEVSTDVTDINGETHNQMIVLRLGYENSFINITTEGDKSAFDAVEYQYCDLNGTPLEGELTMTVERLRQPQTPWLTHEMIQEGVRHTLSESEFKKRYPLMPYTYEETEMVNWQAEKLVFDTRLVCKGLNSNRVPMPRLEAGVYRIRMACGEVKNEAIVVYNPPTSRKVQGVQLLWHDLSTTKAQVGDTVTLRIGSRHSDVTAVYQLLHANHEIDRQLVRIDDNITTFRIPVTEAMLGGFDICLYVVKEGRCSVLKYAVDVPFVHKQLEMEFLTFRDKLTPGDKETWTLKVKRNADSPLGREPVSVGDGAAVLLSMYDAALDSYGALDYSWWPWWGTFSESPREVEFCTDYNMLLSRNLLVDVSKRMYSQGNFFRKWTFMGLNHRNWWRWGNNAYGYMNSVATARGESSMSKTRLASAKRAKSYEVADSFEAEEPMEVNTDMVVVENDAEIEQMGTMVFEVGSGDIDMSPGKEQEEPYIRSNLSTLAFFEPTLRTDKDGTVSYSFTVPDLLTLWNVKGMAWTQDLAVGTLERNLVTQKQLMVQPNMPRFLREGDTATLLAKVMNLTDSDLTVTVDFSFEIPNTLNVAGDTPAILNSQLIKVPAQGSASVSFPVTVPVGGTVATYKFVAKATNHSDGEQGPLPLLTNRQAVTQSVSMYMNGRGSKQYTMSLPTSTTAQPVSFTVEYTANPIWLAIQSLPYMSDCANPSYIYLFNSLYVNTLGKKIADWYPELKHCADNATEQESPLFRNSDIKQTLLSETPWLSAGTSEVERLKCMANYYDADALKRQTGDATAKLQKAQRADGSWSWMPEGRYGSTYVTQYILKGLGILNSQFSTLNSQLIKRALGYVDKEAYRNYLEWMEYLKKHPNSKCKPIMLDYLYTRSYYVGHSFAGNTKQAFDYYYGNAKQRYSDYTSLYDQALLALVFHRNGDTKLAREMVTRIKQKALYSDEMGMYWRDNRAGYFYYQRPVETQALLIETFREVLPADTLSVAQMQQWLLKQKQTTRWSSDIATLRAIQSLMPNTSLSAKPSSTPLADQVVVRGSALMDTLTTPVANSGYMRHTYRADSLAALSKGRNVSATIVRSNKGISWGALYYQYTEQMDRVPASETGITLRRELYRVNPDESLTPVDDQHPLHVGDRFRIRLFVSCDRNLEYVELKAFRAACLEPVSTASGWVWGLPHYYVAVNNSHEAIYIDRLEKGKYTIDADYYVTNPGAFTLAPSVLQCLYAPEFRATSRGQRITVK
ncbi:MAG: hypothetical protein IJK84_01225 [Bacteroidales bacterium]|nr:hypothetical protein [Bacteroidales bacterium]